MPEEMGSIADKQLTNFGILMDLLSISTIELSKTLSVERTAISRWRHGVNKISVDNSYFEEMVEYFVQKNKHLGNELLEEFFESVYPVKKRIHKSYLKKCIRSYILNIPDSRTDDEHTAGSYISINKYIGAHGRMAAIVELFEAAEKLQSPSVIKIFEAEQMDWVACNTNYSTLLYQKIKSALDAGHKVEIIFQVKGVNASNIELHQLFLELAFHDNLTHFLFAPIAGKEHVNSIYLLPQRMSVAGYCFNNVFNKMLSFSTRDRHYTDAQEEIYEKYKRASKQVFTATKPTELEHMLDCIKYSVNRDGEYFNASKELSIVTMSEELLNEILSDNNITKEQNKLCHEFYHAFRATIENANQNNANHETTISGLYYDLTEITAPLTYPSIISYSLSAITGRIVQMSREQYLRHFRDTAELVKNDSRYHIYLHHASISPTYSPTYPKSIWYKYDCWVILLNTDYPSEKIKFSFSDNARMTDIFQIGFQEIYGRIPEHKRSSDYTADVLTKIANCEMIGV